MAVCRAHTRGFESLIAHRMPCTLTTVMKRSTLTTYCLPQDEGGNGDIQIDRAGGPQEGTEMFREMLRKKQQLPQEECIRILREELRGVLSVLGDDGYPYGMPMNHYYNDEDGKIYFHSGKKGHRTDALQRCGKVSFCVCDSGTREAGDWALHIRSVIVFGRIEFVEDRETIYRIASQLSRKFTDDEEYIRGEIERSGPGTMMFALVPEHITGKAVKES